MQSTNTKEIKAALWRQAFIGDTWVNGPMGRVVAIRQRKGQLLALVRGWGRWYPVEHVSIEMQFALPDWCVSQVRGTPTSDRLDARLAAVGEHGTRRREGRATSRIQEDCMSS
jgi:hypothetical protein